MLQNIRTVLVETLHTGNTDFVVRVMRTMRLTNPWLANLLVKPDSQAIALAAGVGDVIGNAHIIDMLNEALAGCSLVVDTSACFRTLPWPVLDPRECGLKSITEAASTLVALVFGRGRVGLTNEELQKCHYHVVTTANPEYSLLNLTMAVQVIVYEVRMVWLVIQEDGEQVEHEEIPCLLVDDLERFYGYPEQTLLATGLICENHPGQVINKLHRLFIRARLGSRELNILRGILAPIGQQNRGSKVE